MRTARILVGLLLTAGLLATPPAAQAQATGGTIYFDATGGGDVTNNCIADNGLTWGASLLPPATTGKAYLDLSTPAVACNTTFELVSPATFTIGGPLVATIVLGCDVPVVVAPGADGIASSWRFELLDTEGGTVGTQFDGVEQIACTPGQTTVLTATIADASLEVVTGDSVYGSLLVFGGSASGGSAGGLYVVTGDPNMYSAMVAPGIPGPAAPGAEAIAIGVTAKAGKALPGEAAIYNLTIRNVGVATNFTFGTEGLPAGYGVAFNPLTGDLAANATQNSLLRVTVPATATPGTKVPFKAVVEGGKGTNATVDLTIEVSRPSTGTTTTRSSSSSDLGEFTNTDDTGTKTSPGVEFLLNVAAVGLLVVALRRRVA